MSNIVTVRKTKISEAIQINSPEDEEVVKGWLEQGGVQNPEALEELKKRKYWFLRDFGDTVVYLSHPADFLNDFEEVEPDEATGSPFTRVEIDRFKGI